MIGYLGDVTLFFHLGRFVIPIQAGFHGVEIHKQQSLSLNDKKSTLDWILL